MTSDRLAAEPVGDDESAGPYRARRLHLRTGPRTGRRYSGSGSQAMKGLQKPKKPGKKPAQKTLKERRTEKRAAAKHNRSLDI